MYNGDTVTIKNAHLGYSEPPNIPEQTYQAHCGHPTGLSTVGFRAGRYKPEEASELAISREAQVDQDISHSKTIRNEMDDMIKEADALVKQNLQNTTLCLKERLTDINFWKTELEREIQELNLSNDILEKRRNEFQRASHELGLVIHVVNDNLNARQRRFGEDYQLDDVELQLLKELDILNKAMSLYKCTLEQCETQNKRNTDVKQDIEMIWSDKKECDELMTISVQLTSSSTNKQYYHGETRRHPLAMQSTPEAWAQHAHDFVLRGIHERLATDQYIQLTENVINDVVRDVVNQKDIVNMTFQKHLDKMENERAKLTNNLRATNAEITRQLGAIMQLRNAISEKEDFFKVVQTRLHLHGLRPCVENCRDAAQVSLMNEAADLERVLEKLNQELAVAENDMKHLQDNQVLLDKQIHTKINNIQVDRDHCVRHRTVIPNSVRLRGLLPAI